MKLPKDIYTSEQITFQQPSRQPAGNHGSARITFLAYFLNYPYTNLLPGNTLLTILKRFKLSTSV